MSAPIANYVNEQKSFRKLITDNSLQRILIFQGDSGVGKSSLLNHCLDQIAIDKVPVIKLEIYDVHDAIPMLFYLMSIQLIGDREEGWQLFDTFVHKVGQLTNTPSDERTGRWLRGLRRYLIQLNVETQSADARRSLYTELAEAWFDDAEKLDMPFVLALDTYEQATTAFDQWFSQEFLTYVADSSMIRVLLAGQTAPNLDSSLHFCTHVVELQGVHETIAWLEISKALGREIPAELLGSMCQVLNGNPSQIMGIILGTPQTSIPSATTTSETDQIDAVKLYETMINAFSVDALEDLCFRLYIDHEQIEHSTKNKFARNLIKHLDQLGRLQELVKKCRILRPEWDWP